MCRPLWFAADVDFLLFLFFRRLNLWKWARNLGSLLQKSDGPKNIKTWAQFQQVSQERNRISSNWKWSLDCNLSCTCELNKTNIHYALFIIKAEWTSRIFKSTIAVLIEVAIKLKYTRRCRVVMRCFMTELVEDNAVGFLLTVVWPPVSPHPTILTEIHGTDIQKVKLTAIGCTVCEIFAFKLYCDLETKVWGHSRLSKWHIQ